MSISRIFLVHFTYEHGIKAIMYLDIKTLRHVNFCVIECCCVHSLREHSYRGSKGPVAAVPDFPGVKGCMSDTYSSCSTGTQGLDKACGLIAYRPLASSTSHLPRTPVYHFLLDCELRPFTLSAASVTAVVCFIGIKAVTPA